jgi:hypothetical protein
VVRRGKAHSDSGWGGQPIGQPVVAFVGMVGPGFLAALTNGARGGLGEECGRLLIGGSPRLRVWF